jgi:hypothetical protein
VVCKTPLRLLLYLLLALSLSPAANAQKKSAASSARDTTATQQRPASQRPVNRVTQVLHEFQEHSRPRAQGIIPPVKVARISESDVNEYLRSEVPNQARLGLKSIQVKFISANYLGATAILDFEKFRGKESGMLERSLMALLSGERMVYLEGTITSQKGMIQFKLEKAYVGSIRVPVFLVEKVANWIGPRTNSVIDLSKSYPLPYELQEIQIETGTLVLRS